MLQPSSRISRLRPVDFKELKKLCEDEGCVFSRQRGDHYIMTKPGLARPIVIPKKKGLREDVVLSIGRTIGLTRAEIEERLTKGRKRRS